MSGWLTVQDVQLESIERGHGRPILWLHGEEGPDPEDAWLGRLATPGRLLAPSHPGFGHAPEAASIDAVDDLAYLYLDLLAQQDARDAVVSGCSLGGWIAAEMAVKCTERVARLILIAPLGIKVGDRETRDIPDIWALHPDEVLRLQYHDPARARLDHAALSDDRLTVIARNREATALYAWEPYFHDPKLRRRGSRRSPGPDTFRTSSSPRRWPSASARSLWREDRSEAASARGVPAWRGDWTCAPGSSVKTRITCCLMRANMTRSGSSSPTVTTIRRSAPTSITGSSTSGCSPRTSSSSAWSTSTTSRQPSPHAHDGAFLGGARPDRQGVDEPRRALQLGRQALPPPPGEHLAASVPGAPSPDLDHRAEPEQRARGGRARVHRGLLPD